ncbi:hypothetical protein [Mastigocladopsis repens]|uniref:hypothetical protein n=1 Tax=Mastigocladopsis repens TaxID=221287 RepID=UPI001E2CF364|nr:hypothetical protein [Mastigocladopsis repens]
MMFWLSLSITVATVYGVQAILPAFGHEYIIQDDARQHIFWMQRFVDPELFPQDLITDYFQSISPPGYKAFYQALTLIGFQPFFLSKTLPILLGVITTIYCFGVCLKILPLPVTGFIGTLLMNQGLWLADDLISATSRAFLYPLFFAFTYYFLQRALLPCLISLAILGLFYPGFVLICVGILILQIFKFDRGLPRFSQQRNDYLFCGLGLVVGLAVLLPYSLESSLFGSLISVREARILPEFMPSGRMSFFRDDNPIRFWLSASRSGIRISFNPPIVILGLFLPLLLRFKSRFPLAKQVRNHISILLHLVVVSLFLFFAAHILLFKLYLPSRFTVHSFKIVFALATAVVLTLILDAVLKNSSKQKLLTFGATALIGVIIVFYPNLFWQNSFPRNSYIVGQVPPLYQFFQQQPKDTLIASLAGEATNIPSFSQRPILVSGEYAIAYHVGYYRQFRQRLADLIRAQYSSNLADVQNLIQKYGVDFFLLEKGAFTAEYLQQDRWLRQYLSSKVPNDPITKITRNALEGLQQGKVPALSKVMQNCTAFETGNLVVLEAKCISQKS